VQSYTIPDHVADVIQFIPGLTSFSFCSRRPVVQSATSAAVKEPKGVPAAVTPETIWKTYQVIPCLFYHLTRLRLNSFWT